MAQAGTKNIFFSKIQRLADIVLIYILDNILGILCKWIVDAGHWNHCLWIVHLIIHSNKP